LSRVIKTSHKKAIRVIETLPGQGNQSLPLK